MWFKHKPWSGKLIILLLTVVMVGLIAPGCVQSMGVPKGWSGGIIADETLYLGSMEGNIVAFDVSSGARLWTSPLETSKPAGGGFGCAGASSATAIYGTPAVHGELVFVGGYIKQGYTANGKIYAFSFGRDEPKWVFPREGYLEGPIIGGLALSQDKVYFGGSDGNVYALDTADGYKDLEEFQTGDKIWSTPVVDGDVVYIGSFDKKLYVLDAATLAPVKWKEFETGGAIAATPLVYEDTIYVGSLDRNMYAIDAADGSQKGTFLAASWFWAGPVAYNNIIYAPNLDHKLYILNAESLVEKISPLDLGSPVYSTPVLVEDKVIIASEEGKIYSLDTSSNQLKTLATLEDKVYAPLFASEGTVYIHTNKDSLYAMDAQTGAMREFEIK